MIRMNKTPDQMYARDNNMEHYLTLLDNRQKRLKEELELLEKRRMCCKQALDQLHASVFVNDPEYLYPQQDNWNNVIFSSDQIASVVDSFEIETYNEKIIDDSTETVLVSLYKKINDISIFFCPEIIDKYGGTSVEFVFSIDTFEESLVRFENKLRGYGIAELLIVSVITELKAMVVRS